MAIAPGSELVPPPPLDAVSMPPRVRRVLENVWVTASGELARQLQVVMHEAELALGRLLEQSRGTPVGDSYAGSLRSLRQHGPELVPRFLKVLQAEAVNLQAPRDSRRFEGLSATEHGWSLVEEAETDEDAVLGDIAARADLRNSLALQLMGQRFGVLAGAPAFDAEHLPLGPHTLCHALRDACASIGMPLDARLRIYAEFGKVAMAHLPSLFETLNARLASEGILPHLHFVPVRVRPATQAQVRDVEVARAPTPRVEHDSTVQHPSDSQSPSDPEPQSPPHDGFATLQDLLARRRALLAKLRSVGNDERLREQLTHEDVLGSLRRMRGGAGKKGTPGDIRQTVLAQARQAHGHGVALGDADSDGFELFGLFMGQLQRELSAGSPGEILVEGLKLPLLQLALRDHRFFVDPDHPARKLLDAVSLAGAKWLGEDDLDPQWLGLLQRAVAMVQADPDAGEETFGAANHALQGGLQMTSRKNDMAERRHVEAARGREKLELARVRASGEIAGLVAGRQLPRFHSLLLEQAWTDVLSLVLLRNGEDSDAWREMREATVAIVDASSGPAHLITDPAFENRLQDALAQVGYHAEDACAIARQLANGRTDDDGLASRTELVVQLKARARLGEENLAHAGTTVLTRKSIEQAAYARLGSVGDGCWIDLLDASQASVVRRRLAWTSPRTGHALLLNRRSVRVDGDDLDALARRLAAGTLLLVEDIHPAEVAWQATLANLQRIAGDQSSTPGASHGS